MRIARVYTGADGRSHLGALTLPCAEQGPIRATPPLPSHAIRFAELGPGLGGELHNAPTRQIVVFLEGRCEVVCGDGSRWEGGAGDVLLAEDTTGEGHRFRELSGPLRVLFVPIPADFELEGWAVRKADVPR